MLARRLERAAAQIRMLVVGGLNVDHHLKVGSLPADDGAARIDDWHDDIGGHAGNCAVALSRLGASVWVLGAVGDDAAGRAILNELRQAGVHTDLTRTVQGRASGRVVIPTLPGRRFMLMSRGANDALTPEAGAIDANGRFDGVLVFDPPPAVTASLLRSHGSAGPPVYWNPGGLLRDRAWFHRHAIRAAAVIVNEVEFGALFEEFGWEQAMGQSSRDGGPFVIVTRGRRGAVLLAGGVKRVVRPYRVRCVDATGAGDAFTAGYALGSAFRLEPAARVRLGNLTGALATTALGAHTAPSGWDQVLRHTGPGDPLRQALEAMGGCHVG
jgi:ribokinase